MNILLLGGGGREHALAHSIKRSPLCKRLIVAPGNAGTAQLAENAVLNPDDFPALRELVLREQIDFVVVGPEAPLAAGIVDYFADDADLNKIPVFGPNQAAARLESSKAFAKQFMIRHKIPTARHREFSASEVGQAHEYVESLQPPIVVKADGLAAGKGVKILSDAAAAKGELSAMLLDSTLGDAGRTVVIEDYMQGIELSVFVLTDGTNYVLLPEAKDYKRIGESDTGLNTGGMGSVSPVPFADDAFMQRVRDKVIEPTLDGLRKDHINYCGFIFFGLMNVDGEPYVIEYNVRMGDPEAQVVLPRIDSDLTALMLQAARGNLTQTQLNINNRHAAAVIVTSEGYPGAYEKGKEIIGLVNTEDVLLFHAGTDEQDGRLLTAGGRVLAVTALADDLRSAIRTSYRNIDKIIYDGKYFRSDIGKDLL